MKSRIPYFAVGVLAAALAVLLFGLSDRNRQTGPALRPDDARLVETGGRIYEARCAACHGARLEGQPHWRERGPDGLLPAPPHDESGHTWHHPDEMLFRLTKHGVARAANLKDYRSAMPAFEGVLSDEEILAVLSWIKAQWPASLRERHNQINAEYRALRNR